MYQKAAILADFLLIYSAVAGRIEQSWTGTSSGGSARAG